MSIKNSKCILVSVIVHEASHCLISELNAASMGSELQGKISTRSMGLGALTKDEDIGGYG